VALTVTVALRILFVVFGSARSVKALPDLVTVNHVDEFGVWLKLQARFVGVTVTVILGRVHITTSVISAKIITPKYITSSFS